jgi:hypothetical protein
MSGFDLPFRNDLGGLIPIRIRSTLSYSRCSGFPRAAASWPMKWASEKLLKPGL